MNNRYLPALAALLLSCLTFSGTQAAPPTPAVVDPRAAADARFDHAANVLARDAVAAKPLFAKAAAAYEQLLAGPLSQSDRARVLYNAGAAHQLAGDVGPAVVYFRRAELLSPGTPGLHERLAAARSAARGDTATSASTTSHDATFGELARNYVVSLPRLIAWRTAIIAFVTFWSLAFLRIVIPCHSRWRPPGSLLVVSAIACFVPAGSLAALWQRDRRAAREVVVLSETIGRAEPDDLTGSPASTTPFKPGTELEALEERAGGNGQLWLRVSSPSSSALGDDAPIWIPESAATRVIDAQR